MKVVFMGTPEFAAICLERILESEHEVVGVITVPDKPAGRGQKLSQSAVAKLAIEKNLNLLQPEKLKNIDFVKELKTLNADAFVVVAFRMLPKEVWQIPAKGTFNLHASLLPDYRGAAPINWAIINGETESGVTTFMIDEKIDTGNILLSNKVEILNDDTAGDLHDKLVEVGKELIIETLNGLEKGIIIPKSQPEVAEEKAAPKIFREDCKIDWNESLENIHNKIRGLSPYPAAWSLLKVNNEEKQIKIYKGHFEFAEIDSGKINQIEFEKVIIKINHTQGHYFIEELQPEGKRRMNAQDFINGLNDKSGFQIV
ncbi:methionyl-tRNA formyltransferase [Moheibacter sediminis]|uniref:Methionyl-tRNA formyltransferase n=1 Tax=Moheibacter sediminis TaxID=1434700 RepID=A0A1W2C3A4_9FLAO|nr:methionyl-tRNA formyltransferase [Moheibacter sediminis]SMC79630.1 methionyl-tRNA formyltransferase [Moheibacter sediminis]